mmetsp:Transcript_3691/g.5602  ORF Transcript_3691/g.5602 Transcript_3691/m.5602 type:complete len:86 (+) Transcript_3691:74-331(+)
MKATYILESEIPLPPPTPTSVRRPAPPATTRPDPGAKRREQMARLLEQGDLSFLEGDIPLPPAPRATPVKKDILQSSSTVSLVGA